MPDRRKIEKYRRTLEELAQDEASRQVEPGRRVHELEGRAAKLGLEIQSEESKAAPGKRTKRVPPSQH